MFCMIKSFIDRKTCLSARTVDMLTSRNSPAPSQRSCSLGEGQVLLIVATSCYHPDPRRPNLVGGIGQGFPQRQVALLPLALLPASIQRMPTLGEAMGITGGGQPQWLITGTDWGCRSKYLVLGFGTERLKLYEPN